MGSGADAQGDEAALWLSKIKRVDAPVSGFGYFILRGETALLVLLAETNGKLVLAADGAQPKIRTSQQAFAALFAMKGVEEMFPETVSVSVRERKAIRHRHGLAFELGAPELASFELPTDRKLKPPKAAKADKLLPGVPFGLGMAPPGSMDGEEPPLVELKVDESDGHESPVTGDADSDLEASEKDDPAPDDAPLPPPPPHPDDALPAGAAVGVVAHDVCDNNRAKCFVCAAILPDSEAKFKPGEIRLWWRPARGRPEKSLHARCVVSGGLFANRECKRVHLLSSSRYLEDASTGVGLEAPDGQRNTFLDAAHACREELTRLAGGAAAAASG